MNILKRALVSVPFATEIFDKGRRGNPLPGCDCVQCFGYCMVNQLVADQYAWTPDTINTNLSNSIIQK